MVDFAGFTIGRYLFDLTVTEDIILPPYKGFAFRGVLGHTLRALACSIPDEECHCCPFHNTCVYGYLFETVSDVRIADHRKFSSYPRPYVIKPPHGQTRHFKRYDKMSFEIILAGRSAGFLPHVVTAFDQIGRDGIRDGTGRYLIKRIRSFDAAGTASDVFREGSFLNAGKIIRWEELMSSPKLDSVTLRFVTPLLIEDRGVPVTEPPSFKLLIENLLRRAELLYSCHGSGENMPALKSPGGDDVRIIAANMHWRELERISNRQRQRLKTGGLVGEITYSGNIDPYIQLLLLGEIINIGKSTTFGFGSYQLTLLNA